MNPFLGLIRDNIKSGKHFCLVDNDLLLEIGISGLGARKMILQAIQLLQYFVSSPFPSAIVSPLLVLRGTQREFTVVSP